MDQRVGLLTERLDVIADLLAVLKDQLSHSHGEYLEWIGRFWFLFLPMRCLVNAGYLIACYVGTMSELTPSETVIVLIAAEILVAAVNIVVDLYAGVD